MLDRSGLHLRAALFHAIRTFFTSRGFLEVDTPLRQPVILPESNIAPLMADGQFLQTSPELCMKLLLAAGCQDIFQICPCFRKGELGRYHLEEFTMLEWYRSGADYRQLMVDCEELLAAVAARLIEYDRDHHHQRPRIDISAAQLLMSRPARRLSVAAAFRRYAPLGVEAALRQEKFEELLVEWVEPHLGVDRPLFLVDYPRELASLARVDPRRPAVSERFELYVAGLELANGFTELTDKEEQRRRFSQEIEQISARQGRETPMPEHFLDQLENIESAAGIALGLDRLLMLLLGEKRVDAAVTFSPDDLAR
ncbi:MAG: EF-P lysine aminoacylase EpmA [Desulfopila sp.]